MATESNLPEQSLDYLLATHNETRLDSPKPSLDDLSTPAIDQGYSQEESSIAEQVDQDLAELDEKLLDASSEGNQDEIRNLMTARNEDGETALHIAAKSGSLWEVEELLSHPEFESDAIDAIDDDEYTPLFNATMLGHDKIVEKLLSTGKVNVNHERTNGARPLSFAAAAGYVEIVLLLLKEPSIQVNEGYVRNFIPLHIAASEGHLPVVNALLLHTPPRFGAQINIKDFEGYTALHFAARRGHDDVVAYLLEKGADQKCKSDKLQSALQLAIEMKHPGTGRILIANLTDEEMVDMITNDDILRAAKYSAFHDLIEKYLKLGSAGMKRKVDEDIEKYCPRKNRTVLHWAVYHGQHILVWNLLKGSEKLRKIPRPPLEMMAKTLSEGNKKTPTLTDSERAEQIKNQNNLDGNNANRILREAMIPSYNETLEALSYFDMVFDARDVLEASILKGQCKMPSKPLGDKLGMVKDFTATIVDIYYMSKNDSKEDDSEESNNDGSISEASSGQQDSEAAKAPDSVSDDDDFRFTFLRQSRSVWDVIYEQGPSRIMWSARELLQKFQPELSCLDSDNSFEARWIHLPANNVRIRIYPRQICHCI